MRYAISLFVILASAIKVSYAQQLPLDMRDNLILATFHTIQEKEEAIRDAIREAQMKSIEGSTLARHRPSDTLRDYRKARPLVHPYLTIKTTYDTNIDNVEHDPNGDIINKITPGLKMNFVGRNRALNLDFYLDNLIYSDQTNSTSQDAVFGLLGNFNLGKYILAINNTYYNNYLASRQFGVRTDIFQRRQQNNFTASLARQFNRYGLSLESTRNLVDYEHDYSISNDRYEDIYTLNQNLKITPKTLLQFGYSRARTRYTKQTSIQNYHDFVLVLSSVLSAKLSGSLNLEYKPITNKSTDNQRERKFGLNLGYSQSNRSNVSFDYDHIIKDLATTANYKIENIYTLSANHRLAFNPRFNLSFGQISDFIDYPKRVDKNRHTNTYTFTLGLSYAFRQWLDFSLDWKNFRQKSNTTDTTYHEDVFSLLTQARF